MGDKQKTLVAVTGDVTHAVGLRRRNQNVKERVEKGTAGCTRKMMRRNVVAIVMLVALVAAGSMTLAAAEGKHEHSHDDAIHKVKDVNVTMFNETMQEPDAFILDVRSKEEFDKGHIEGAVQITSDELPNRDGELPENKESPVLVYCNSGRRSADVANTLLFMGYENVMNLEPGIKGWVKAGMPVV